MAEREKQKLGVGLATDEAYAAIFWPTPSLKEGTSILF